MTDRPSTASTSSPTCEVRPTGQEWRDPCGRPTPCVVHSGRADSPSPEGAIIITPDHEGDARRIAASLADMIGSASGSPEGAKPCQHDDAGQPCGRTLVRGECPMHGREAWPNPDACCLRNAFDEDAHSRTCSQWPSPEGAEPPPFSEWGQCQSDCCDAGDRLHLHGSPENYRAWREAALPEPSLDVDWLANVIRQEDGNHSLGAGALAERIVARLRGTEGSHR